MAELLGAFEQSVLLTIVSLRDEAYGRSVLRGVESVLNREVAAGAIYATLDRLEQKGLVASCLGQGTPARDGRSRRYYRVTASGAAALNDSKRALERMWQSVSWPIREAT